MMGKQAKGFELRQLSPEELDELSARFEALLTTGRLVEGTSPAVDISVRPDYFDQSGFDAALKTVNKYYLSLALSSSIGLVLLVQLDEILIPLLKTGKSRTVADLYDRYSATAKYIKHCYESRFYEPTSEGWRHISIVRSMHQRIFKLMNSDEQNRSLIPTSARPNGGQYVWVNQFDMAVTQFAFIGLLMLRPDKCGAKGISEGELREVVYFWRLFSHQFGIEDRFNLFVYHEDLAKQLKLLELVFGHYKDRLVKPRRQVGVRMAEGILLAFEDLATDTTMNIVEHHWFDVISLTGRQELLPYQGARELWKLGRFRLVFALTSSNELTRRLVVRLYKRKLEKFCAKGEKVRKKLARKYPKHTYELEEILRDAQTDQAHLSNK